MHAAKERVLHDFYSALLGAAVEIDLPPPIANLLDPVAVLSSLEAPFLASEVKEALWQMRTASSPGPDGFGPALYRAFWPVVGDAVLTFLDAFHCGDALLEWINQALIVLLSKKLDVTTANGFHPMSLQNCAPKLAAKVFTNRLQGVVPSLISNPQIGFDE